MKYECSVCAYIYDEDKELIKFQDLDYDWLCPVCGAEKDMFHELKN